MACDHNLDALFKGIPPITPEEARKAADQMAGSLFSVTQCKSCGEVKPLHRAGCACNKDAKVAWLWMDQSGSLLECGKDFTPVKANRATTFERH